MITTDDSIEELLRWCHEQNIEIDTRIVVCKEENATIVVRALDAAVESNIQLVSIPKSAILSSRNCSLSEMIPQGSYGTEAQLGLTLGLYGEMLRGAESSWYGYLQSLPSQVNIPLTWDIANDDEKAALSWLRGTMAESELMIQDWKENPKVMTTCGLIAEWKRRLRNYYSLTAEPALVKVGVGERATLSGFIQAFTLVSSRAFIVDAYHGLSMVPVADAFNHTINNQVHLQSDYYVCPLCGSLFECVHDSENIPNDHSQKTAKKFEINRREHQSSIKQHYNVDTCEMVTNDAIHPFSEIYNTYGDELTNAQLLIRYGFLLDNNENDIITWNAAELQTAIQMISRKFTKITNIDAGGGDLYSLSASTDEVNKVLPPGAFERQTVERCELVTSREDQGGTDFSQRSVQVCKAERTEDQVPKSGWVEVLLERLDLVIKRWTGGWDDLKKSELIYIPNDQTDQEKEDLVASHGDYIWQKSLIGNLKVLDQRRCPSIPLWLNSEGQMSFYLWLFGALLSLHLGWIVSRPTSAIQQKPAHNEKEVLPTTPDGDIASIKSILLAQCEMEELSDKAREHGEGRSGDAMIEVNKVKVQTTGGFGGDGVMITTLGTDDPYPFSVPETVRNVGQSNLTMESASNKGYQSEGPSLRRHRLSTESESSQSNGPRAKIQRTRSRLQCNGVVISVSALPTYASDSDSDIDNKAQQKDGSQSPSGSLHPLDEFEAIRTSEGDQGKKNDVLFSDRRLNSFVPQKSVLFIARLVGALCKIRIERMLYPNLDAAALADIVDLVAFLENTFIEILTGVGVTNFRARVIVLPFNIEGRACALGGACTIQFRIKACVCKVQISVIKPPASRTRVTDRGNADCWSAQRLTPQKPDGIDGL